MKHSYSEQLQNKVYLLKHCFTRNIENDFLSKKFLRKHLLYLIIFLVLSNVSRETLLTYQLPIFCLRLITAICSKICFT